MQDAEAWRAALDATTALEAVGSCDYGGEPHTFVLRLARDGRFALDLKGPLASGFGFDGSSGWTIGWSRKLDSVDGPDLAVIQLAQWVWGGLWRDHGLPWSVGRKRVAAHAEIVAIRTFPGPVDATLEVDPATGLHRRLAIRTAKGEASHEYQEFVDVDGVQMPRRWKETDGGVATNYTVDAFRWIRGHSFAAPSEPPGYATFDTNGTDLAAERAPTGHQLVKTSLDGGEAGWFVLDTGASVMVLDSGVARARGFPLFGAMNLVGAGGEIKSRFCRVPRVQAGPLTLRDVAFLCTDLSMISTAAGRQIEGICGYDVLCRCVADLDLGVGGVSLHPSSGRRGGMRLEMRGNVPAIPARFAPDHEETFLLDIGFPGTVLFHEPAVRRLGLGPKQDGQAASEFGGTTRLGVARLEWFQLGDTRLEAVDAILAVEPSGAYGDPFTAGRIGSALLGSRRIVLDYALRSVAVLQTSAR